MKFYSGSVTNPIMKEIILVLVLVQYLRCFAPCFVCLVFLESNDDEIDFRLLSFYLVVLSVIKIVMMIIFLTMPFPFLLMTNKKNRNAIGIY